MERASINLVAQVELLSLGGHKDKETLRLIRRARSERRSLVTANERQYACSLESVRGYLAGYNDVSFYKGRFPETSAPVEHLQFSFVNFDVDLYEGTLACLQFFYPRMIPGGIMLSHDYSILAGVRTAFAEYLSDKPEGLIELPTTQCMLIKL